MKRYVKDPDARLDFGQDWANWLDEGELITSHEVLLNPPSGLTLVSHVHTTSKVIIWVTDGTVGVSYRVTYRITTDQGRTDDRTDVITIQER